MSRDFPDSVLHRLVVSSQVTPNFPFSIAAWVYPESTGRTHGIYASSGGPGNDNTKFLIESTDILKFLIFDATVTYNCISSNTITQNEWNHTFVSVADSDWDCILNGNLGSKGTATHTAKDISDHTQTQIGVLGIYSSPMDGLIAWVTVWDAKLTDEEGVALANGTHPLRVRPDNVVVCAPLWGEHSPEIDLRNPDTPWPITGSLAADQRQPPMELWTPTRRVFKPVPNLSSKVYKDLEFSGTITEDGFAVVRSLAADE